jgi:hypothetical protein
MKKCVLNWAKGEWYPRGQQRLIESLKNVGFDGDVLTFTEEKEINCPTHQKVPYGFKPYALKYAVEQGYELILWCDASVWAIKPIDAIFDEIEKNNYCFFYNCLTGTYSSDASLKSFDITREESFNIPMLMGICMGFNMSTDICKEFLKRWLEKANDGITFPGCWHNNHNEVSDDPRVLGHRHDQTAASIIAHQLNMKLIISHLTYFQYYENPTNNTYAANPDMSLIYDNVVLIAQGM